MVAGDGDDGNGGDGGLPEGLGPALIIVLVAVIVVIVIAVTVMNIRNRKSDYGKTSTEPISDYWLDSK